MKADECPLRVSAIDLEGKGTSDRVYRYRVVLTAEAGDTSTDAGLQVQVVGGRTAIHARASKIEWERESDVYSSVIIFERPKEDVSSVQVVDTGEGPANRPCSSSAVAIGSPKLISAEQYLPTAVVAIDDSKSTPPDVSSVVLSSGRSESNAIKTEAPIRYPMVSMDLVSTGEVRVGIRIGPTGSTEKVWIIQSSGSESLDDAATSAAAESTYSPAILDGILTATDFRMLVGFYVGDHLSTKDVLATNCLADPNEISLVNGLPRGSGLWYDLDISTARTDAESLSLVVFGARSSRTVLHWSPVLGEDNPFLRAMDEIRGDHLVSGALFWPGGALGTAEIQDVTPHLNNPVSCKPRDIVSVDNAIDKDSDSVFAETNSPWLNAPILESVIPAQFANLIWPKYVPSAKDPKSAVAIKVSVHVTPTGEPLAARAEGVSIAPDFAEAALDAAMASTYVVPRSPDLVPLTQTFEIFYVYVPAT